MTPAQMTAFRAALFAEGNAAVTANRSLTGNHQIIVDFYNAEGTVDIWRASVSVDQLKNGLVGTEFTARGVPQRDLWFALTQGGAVDPREANIRAGFVEALGSGGSSIANMTSIATGKATRFEQLFVTNKLFTDLTATGVQVTLADVRNAIVAGP